MKCTSNVEIFNPEGHPPLASAYSHISIGTLTAKSKIVSFAGEVGIDAGATGDSAASFKDQVRQALVNLDKRLAAASIKKEDIISTRQFVVRAGSMSAKDKNFRADVYLE